MHTRTACAVVTAAALLAAFALVARAHEEHARPTGTTSDPNAPKRVSEATALAIGLETHEVDFGVVERIERLTGIVRPLPEGAQAVAPRMAGVLRSIRVRPGDSVRSGDVIAEVDSPESLRLTSERTIAASRVDQAAAAGEIAREREALLRADVERLEAGAGAVAQNVVSERRARLIEAQGEVRRLEADLVQSRQQSEALDRLTRALDASESGVLVLRASIDGVVVSIGVIPGQGVEAGQSVARVVDLRRVQIEGEAPESLMSRFSAAKGALVRIRADGGVALEGVVRFVSPVIDAAKRTGHLIIDADNASGELREGQFVALAVVRGVNESAVVVPASAIVREGPLEYVFVQEEGVFLRRDVATGVRDDRAVEIRMGLVPGDVVASAGAFSLSQLRGEALAAEGPTGAPTDGHGHTHD